MDMLVCPHCKKHRIVTSRIPSDMVVVLPCPSCHELSVVYRNHVIPISRRIIERGSFEERKTHLAEVIAEFLEAGIFPTGGDACGDACAKDSDMPAAAEDAVETDIEFKPISPEEMEKFARIDLKCIDNTAYFRRHFG